MLDEHEHAFYAFVIAVRNVRRTWRPEEDDAIVSHVRKYGPKNWSLLKKCLMRSGKQCRERWTQQLDPELDFREASLHELEVCAWYKSR